MKNKLKNIVMLVVSLVIAVSFSIPTFAAGDRANTNDNLSNYSSDWTYWSQGASKYWGMRKYGCRVVSQAKMLKEAGIITASSFNPDEYFEWCIINNKYVNANNMKEQTEGRGPVDYAKVKGKSISYGGQINFGNKSKEEKCKEVMNYINSGYYVILGCTAHHAYVGRDRSLSAGTPVILDSWSSWSYNTSSVQKYINYNLVNFSYFRIYSVGNTKDLPIKDVPSQSEVLLPAKNDKVNFSNIKASNISETNAKLSASVSYSGTRPSEVGIYLGNSTGSMRKVGSDKINHSKNPFDMWYDLNKCGVTLSAGTQYYYKMYAIVNGKEFTSGTKNFFAPITIMTAPEEKPPKITAPTSTVDFSNIKASNISETNAKLSASVSYSGKHPSEVGIYLGDSTGSMRKVSSDKINHSKNPFDMWYDLNKHGVTLSAGTQYYYKMYAIVDGKEFTSKTKNFWTSLTISVNSGSEKKNPDPVGMPAVSVDGSTVSASWNSVANATSYDVYLVQEPWDWGDIKYRGSTQGTSYTFTNVRNGAYAAFVIARPNKDTVQSEWSSFNVNVASTSTADFYNINASNVSRTNAQLNASISYSGNHPSEVGVYFGNSTDSMRKVGSDAINHNKNPFDMWYSLNKYGVTLSAGTTYYYKMYAIMDGREVTSNVQSFTTPAQVNSNLVTARVSGTPGGLAINSQPNQYTKIGRMDEGVYCTIDLSRTSGNWYYVTYNGVSGYAYNRYLVIQ